MSNPSLEDLLAEWWRDSYPHAAPINNQTASLIVAFAACMGIDLYAIDLSKLF